MFRSCNIYLILCEICDKKDTFNIVCKWVINPPQKHHLFPEAPLLNLQTVRAPPFMQFPPIYWCFATPLKNQIFQRPPIILKFFIFDPIPSSKSN